ncbi:uncharacterized protein LOC103064858 [Python bivittatus]|uniref:Uncharacterized protein LOC103064858 n=1 Tax=Python bivittatus TaxID=176946 RepID=A0A9F2R1U0_PYTBI|nr:uncharacterized protein LOC103064858 [Python bivittatus]
MDPFRNHQGSQKAILLAGCILCCLLQLVPAQKRLTVIPKPSNPKQGENVLLVLKGVPDQFETCEWTPPSGNKVTFPPQESSGSKTIKADAVQTITVHQNCSLDIRNLTQSATGNYMVTITADPAKKLDTKDEATQTYTGSIVLNISIVFQITIQIIPANPSVGQNITLIPGMPQKDIVGCDWSRITKSGAKEKIYNSESESKKQQDRQKTVQEDDCSLHITQLTANDFGNYIVEIEVSSDQNPSPGKGTSVEPKFYRGQVVLQARTQDGGTAKQQPGQSPGSGSASLKYSAGIIAAALFGSLAWTSTLSLFSLLFCMFSSFFPEC